MACDNDTLHYRFDSFIGEVGVCLNQIAQKSDNITGKGEGAGWGRKTTWEIKDNVVVTVEFVIRNWQPAILVTDVTNICRTYFHAKTTPLVLAGFIYSRFFAPV